MTSSQVTNQTGITNMPWMNSGKPNVKTEPVEFSDFMGNVGAKNESGSNVKTDVKTASDNDRLPKEEKEPIADSTRGRKEITGSEVSKEGEPSRDEIGAVKETIEKIVEAIEEALDITPEELEEALANLGLTQMALLDPANIVKISLELTGTGDSLSLVTNGELYDTVNALENTVKALTDELMNELNVNPGEFMEAVSKASELTVSVNEEAVSNNEEAVKNPGDEENALEEKLSWADREIKEVKNFSIHNNETGKDETGTDKETEGSNPVEDRIHEAKEGPATFVQNLIDRTREALNAREPEDIYTTEQTRLIMDQITESIKVNLSDEFSEISLKLHPESLGNVSVKVSANSEGVLTAQFTAQNESVKAVIEAQAIVLKETLEAKGVTVEAVEVMVGTHEFERNLSDSERRNAENQSGRNRVRRINLSEGEEEAIDDGEDIITKEMMIQNGNTIDYTA